MQPEAIATRVAATTIASSWDDQGGIPLQALPRVREPLPTVQSYCQSKVYSFHAGKNGLLSASAVLFSLVGKLQNSIAYDNVMQLRENLIHEIKAFESSAHTQGYQPEQILLARYAICAALDEAIGQTGWGDRSDWQQQGLLYFFQGEVWGGEAFFVLLDRLNQNPQRHLELLEFFYMCLVLGFQGQYRVFDLGKQQLQQVMEKTYGVIHTYRDEPNMSLSGSTKNLRSTHQPDRSRGFPVWVIGFFSVLLLILIYGGFNFMLKLSVTPLYNKLNHISQSLYYYVQS
jgi:type VI secretion system protein ImpK